jgi:hypothetical protein
MALTPNMVQTLICVGKDHRHWMLVGGNQLRPHLTGPPLIGQRSPTSACGSSMFEPKWEEPFIIEQVYDDGTYQLVDHQGLRPMPPVNGRYLKKYFA